MLTWINEKAKWIIAISAVGIGVGLLAMDNLPDQNARYPLGEVNGRKISAEEFDVRVKQITENRQGSPLEDEQYAALRADVFRSFVRQYVLEDYIQQNELSASVAEMKDELIKNPNAVRNLVANEAQQRLYMIRANSANAEEANQRMQAYLASLPAFLLDSTFNQESYEQWLNTPAAYEWVSMLQYEQELKSSTIPMKQLQTFVAAGFHPTSLEARYASARRLNELDMQVASVPAEVFADSVKAVDSAAVVAYFNAAPDSFFVTEDMMRVQYAMIPIEASQKDDANLLEYAMTLYNQLADSSATFEDLARTTSEDHASAEQGGSLGDYTARGVWVKPFEEVAFGLDSGEISKPVRTPFGYHIIRSLGKKTNENGEELVKASHILITVTASVETEDSLSQILSKVKTAVEAGNDFADAAKQQGVEAKTSSWIGKQKVQLDNIGYLQGLASFLFVNENSPEIPGKISDVLKNKKYVVLVMKSDSLVAGQRNVEPYFETIRTTLQNNAAKEAAAKYLTEAMPALQAWNAGDSALPEIPNVKVSTEHASLSGYVPGIGVASPVLTQIVKNQKVGEWGPVTVTENGAAVVRINAETKAAEESIAAASKEETLNTYRYGLNQMISDFVSGIETSAEVVNNLNLYYKD